MKHIILLLISSSLFLVSCVKSRDDVLEKKYTEKYAGNYNVASITLTTYDTATGGIKTTTTTPAPGFVEMGVDPDGLSFNTFHYKLSVASRLMSILEGTGRAPLGADGSRSCYWIPDLASRRILIYGLSGGGTEYTQANIEQTGSGHLKFTYIEATTGFDGGTGNGTTMKLKEVWELEKK